MISGKLLLERYFYDPHHSGLVWDTYPIFRNVPGEDEDGLNFRIGEMNYFHAFHEPTVRR